ncbi:hypothetical protein [Kutzneria sp. CA-103260]|uniref:hypothetical protein n=1 Tax=Kutzneria sp. CA-103260 TaxID=2802641 RepID=UPI001BA57E94|nr:hypothetical protein [Kutzneria sp. CA-103260]QUQ70898.1 hypothetical protein JJ691_86810 [Kutzneria sp. CA-103260]
MNTGGFSTDVDLVLDRASQLDGLSDTAQAIFKELSDALDAAGQCWGTDQVGQSFASGYTDAAEATFELVKALPGQLTDVGGRLADHAHIHRSADQAIATGRSD